MTPEAPVDDGGARHLIAGIALPDVVLPSTRGLSVNLGTRTGRSVVYIYPWTGRPGVADPPGWDDIPGAHGSTPETEGFRDAFEAYRELGVEVFGLSSQDSAHQGELVERLGLPFAVLSDANFVFQRALGLPTFTAGSQTFLKRLTCYVRDGRVQHVFYPVHPPADHAKEVLGWLLQAGGDRES